MGVPALLLFGGVVWISSHRSFVRLVEETEKYTRGLARYHASQIEQKLARASKIPENLALFVETSAYNTEPRLEGFLRDAVERNPEVYGSCLAFEPESFTPGKHFYAPYFYRNYQKNDQLEFVQLGNPDYNYFHWEWYEHPKQVGHALWTEPYFDDGGGNTIMTTYSVPMRREGKFWGIATIDIAMSQLMDEVAHLHVGQTGYTFIVSGTGKFLAFPDKSKLMHHSIQEINGELGALMASGREGFLRTMEPLEHQAAWVAYAPVQNGGFSLAVVIPEAEVLGQALHLQWELIALGVLGLLALFASQALVARSISRPVSDLAHAAQQVAAGNLDYEVRTDARTLEVRDLATSFRKMVRDLKMRMEELRYTTMVNERIEGELSAARTIQLSLICKQFPVYPDRPEVDIHAMLKPARAVGGDFYDFFFIGQDTLCLLAADVAGKGVPAALYMSVSRTLVRANAALAHSPAELLSKVNEELCREGSSSGMFVSLGLALVDVRTGAMQVCNAGHPPPLRLSAEGQVSPLPTESGVALGAWLNSTYRATRHQLQAGDTILFYTDGITEALSPEEEFYTAVRLANFVGDMAGQSAERIVRAVTQDVRNFCGSHEQADDLTLLVLRWNGPLAGAPREKVGEWVDTFSTAS